MKPHYSLEISFPDYEISDSALQTGVRRKAEIITPNSNGRKKALFKFVQARALCKAVQRLSESGLNIRFKTFKVSDLGERKKLVHLCNCAKL